MDVRVVLSRRARGKLSVSTATTATTFIDSSISRQIARAPIRPNDCGNLEMSRTGPDNPVGF